MRVLRTALDRLAAGLDRAGEALRSLVARVTGGVAAAVGLALVGLALVAGATAAVVGAAAVLLLVALVGTTLLLVRGAGAVRGSRGTRARGTRARTPGGAVS
ncbi:MAG: hypothetical protein ABEH77_08240 [Halobacteriaceae archaeon]